VKPSHKEVHWSQPSAQPGEMGQNELFSSYIQLLRPQSLALGWTLLLA